MSDLDELLKKELEDTKEVPIEVREAEIEIKFEYLPEENLFVKIDVVEKKIEDSFEIVKTSEEKFEEVEEAIVEVTESVVKVDPESAVKVIPTINQDKLDH